MSQIVWTGIGWCLSALLAILLSASTTPIYKASGDPKHKAKESRQRTAAPGGIALCYARKSVTLGENDTQSIERQIENMKAAAAKLGLIAEFYIDADGHKSGREENNRAAWLKLKCRIGQPGVVALILNDLSRAHRKGWRVGQLIELLEQADMKLILAGPDRAVDFTSSAGRFFVGVIAMVDEWYAEDLAIRQRDRYMHLRQQGLNAGVPPFGTLRGEGGLLTPSPFGAWLLADGRWAAGRFDDDPPEPAAIWRGYYECTRHILEWYSHNDIGADGLMYRLRNHGWAFRNQQGNPALFDRDAVRRIIASWPKYAGLVVDGRLKDRRADDIPLDWPDTNRNLFPLSLLRQVAQVERDRRKSRAIGSVNTAHHYALRGLIHCAHCATLSSDGGGSLPIAHLTGTDKNGPVADPDPNRRSYKHAPGMPCSCHRRSVREPVLNHDVRHWLAAFHFVEAAANLLTAHSDTVTTFGVEQYEELEAQRRMALRSCHRRLSALDNGFNNGTLPHPDAYPTARARIVEQQTRLKHRVIPKEAGAVSMAVYLTHVCRPVQLWDVATVEDRQALMSLLVVRLDYDLDQQGTQGAITGYVLQPWAERLLTRD